MLLCILYLDLNFNSAHQDDVGAGGLVPTLDGHNATAPKKKSHQRL